MGEKKGDSEDGQGGGLEEERAASQPSAFCVSCAGSRLEERASAEAKNSSASLPSGLNLSFSKNRKKDPQQNRSLENSSTRQARDQDSRPDSYV